MSETKYEYVNHPPHYNKYEYEVIEMMRRIYGDEKVKIWCELTAFKYRMRAGDKPNTPVEVDFKKEEWCLNKKKELDNLSNENQFDSGFKTVIDGVEYKVIYVKE